MLNDHIETSHFGRGHVRDPTRIVTVFPNAASNHVTAVPILDCPDL
ncbi:hypothetical protein RMSM_02323 [Rhodopirellula maiorica SM1]|uniref:Uncharacterized protein n=1 Tax=Rhodopirellula maiorica SM1 TaxID=1265738 RepID=M5S3J9_9BACT|nr:hypothetical protein RMSM_02323 [Rhodopirellula maiorica SM1]